MTTSEDVRSAALDSAKLTLQHQLTIDVRTLETGAALTPYAVTARPKPVSKRRGFFTVLAMLVTFGAITFLGEACRAWWWPKDHLDNSFLGALLTLVIDLTLLIGSPILGLIAACVVGGIRSLHAQQDARAYVVADFAHRFWTEREWIRQQLAVEALDPPSAIAMLQGQEAPVGGIRTLGTGSALTDAALVVPPPPPKPVSRTRKVLRFLRGGLLLLFAGAVIVAEITDPDVSAADLASGETSPARPTRTTATDETRRQARDVLTADASTLAGGQALAELPAPPEPVVRKNGMLQGWGLKKTALLFLGLWAVCAALVFSWSSGSGSGGEGVIGAIGAVLAWAMTLLLGLCGALILMLVAFVFYSFVYDARGAVDHDANVADRLRYDFWREREALRTGLASGAQQPDEVLAMLRGVAAAPPTIDWVLKPDR